MENINFTKTSTVISLIIKVTILFLIVSLHDINTRRSVNANYCHPSVLDNRN